MGDRKAGVTTFLSDEFHSRYGAGAVEMRRFDDTGMDGPWAFGSGSVCVDDGQVVTIPINSGSTLPADVDDLKAVIWWYDWRHQHVGQSNRVDDIDLALYTTGGSLLRNSDDPNDNKERVHHGSVGGQAVELRLTGADVTSTAFLSQCGFQNSMLVYYAFFYEDDDRDDYNGPPSSEIEAER